jgi:hypothetical protein
MDPFAPLERPYNWQDKFSPFREALQTQMDVYNSSPELESESSHPPLLPQTYARPDAELLKTSHLALPRLPPASRPAIRALNEGRAGADEVAKEAAADKAAEGRETRGRSVAGPSGKRREETSDDEQRVGAGKRSKVDSEGKGKAIVGPVGGNDVSRVRVVKGKK